MTGMDEFPNLQEILVPGFSMRFFIDHGDTVRVRRIGAGEVNLGDIVVFLGERGSRPLIVIHRVMWKRFRGGAWTLWTKGDASLGFDPVLRESALVGKVTAIRRGAGAWKDIGGPSGRFRHLAAGVASSLLFGGVGLAYMALRRVFRVLSRLPALRRLQGDVIDDRLFFKRIFPDETSVSNGS